MATRCKTGWRIRQDRHTHKWEAYRNTMGPEYQQFDTWRRAMAYVEATVYGAHSEARTRKRSVAYFSMTPPRHTPHDDRWDASWLLFSTKRVIGFDGSRYDGPIIVMDTHFTIDGKGPRWTLTQTGWTEAMGISGPVAEAFQPQRYWHRDMTRLCVLCRRPRDNDHENLCPICLAAE